MNTPTTCLSEMECLRRRWEAVKWQEDVRDQEWTTCEGKGGRQVFDMGEVGWQLVAHTLGFGSWATMLDILS
jgi:hypothetical protein